MGIRHFDVMDLGRVSMIKPEQLGYKDSLEIIKDESFKVQKSFVKIGWYLKHIRDNELYTEGGYANIWECAADQLGYSQSTASRFINICEKFSKDHNSPELDERYAGFDKSQMIEMLPMEPDQLDRVSPDMTVKQIRNIKEKKESGENEKQAEDYNIPGQTSIEEDFPEYLPEEFSKPEDDMPDAYATSQENDKMHDESWFVEQYVKIKPAKACELFQICRREKNNSDRAKAVQKYMSPCGYSDEGCSEYDFTFYGFAGGVELQIGSEKIHLRYGRFIVELMKILEKRVATSHREEACEPVQNDECIEEDYEESEEKIVEGEYREIDKLPMQDNDQQRKRLSNFSQDEQIRITYLLMDIVEQLKERMCSEEDAATNEGCHLRNQHFRDAIDIVTSYMI